MKTVTLSSIFQRYNKLYFYNKLRVSSIRFGRIKYLGETDIFDDADPIITLNNQLKKYGFGRIIHIVILHEMIHVAHPNLITHGPKFLKQTKRLMKLGAYNDLL